MSISRTFPSLRLSSISLVAVLFLVSMMALVACGGGDDEDDASERDTAIANSPALQTIEAMGGTTTPASSVPTVPPSPTPVQEISMEEAAKQLWVFLSKCITLDTSDIEAVQVEGNWYVRASLASNHETGLWEVPTAGQSVQPYDQRAKDWFETVEGNCSAAKMRVMTTPIPPTPVVSGAMDASAVIWGYLVRCVSDLSKDNVHAQNNPLKSEWVVTTDEVYVGALNRKGSFGVWSVSYDGAFTTKDVLAQVWDAYIFPTTKGGECAKEYVPNIKFALPSPTPVPTNTPAPTPTERPVPTPTPKIRAAAEAEKSVWAYLVPCFSNIDLSDFTATFDSSQGIYVVVHLAGATTSTWSVTSQGAVTATNQTAKGNAAVVRTGSC